MLEVLDRQVRKKTTSRCPVCLAPIAAEVVVRDGKVYLVKSCDQHGRFEILIADDESFYYDSRGAESNACCGEGKSCATAADGTDHDAPFDVLSTCIALIEIVDSCNLSCPTCFSSSPLHAADDVDCTPFAEFVDRVGGVLNRKGHIEVLQLSGGEPTVHPEFFRLLDWALEQKRIDYVLINTNAVRIATDEAFRGRLAESRSRYGKFELYVQFDGPQEEGQFELRGADLRDIRRRAIDGIGELGVPSTLAMTVTRRNLPFLGDTLRFGLERKHCRGITFQPMFNSGRTPQADSALPIAVTKPVPISVGDIVTNVVEQSRGLLTPDDFTPLPCGDPNCHTLGYLLRTADGPVGLGKLVNLKSVQKFLHDRVNYNIADLARCGCDNEPLGQIIKEFEVRPDQPFRMFVKPFMDAWTYDQDRIDRCCTHVIRPDGKLDSFCRYYLHGGAAGLGLK